MLTIRINTGLLVSGIRDIILTELPLVEPATATSKTEGPISEKQLETDILIADADLCEAMESFIYSAEVIADEVAENSVGLPDTLVYQFAVTIRKFLGRSKYVCNLIERFLKERTAASVFASLNAELAERHGKESAAVLDTLLTLFYEKRKPVPHHYTR